jgi:hypothetical protein
MTSQELREIRGRVELGQPVADIAAALGRPAETIAKAVARLFPKATADELAAAAAQSALGGPAAAPRERLLADLHNSELWRQVKSSFFPHEQRFYEDQYADMLEQFGGDVLATERVQVHDAVTLSVLKHRNLAAQKEAIERRRDAEAEWERINKLWPLAAPGQPIARDEATVRTMEGLQERARQLGSQLNSLVREHSDLDEKHRKIFESLKSTREQRIERLTKTMSFQDLMKVVLSEDKRETEGKRAALMKQVGRREAERLARPIKLADGTVDSPLFTPDTVLKALPPAEPLPEAAPAPVP